MRSSTCKTWLGRLATLLMAFVVSGALAFAQTKTVTGTVVDNYGEPVLGANVIVAGTTNGAVTDFDGNFSLTDVPENATLKVSFIGYISQEVALAGQSKVKVVLMEDSQQLDDVVVVGYGVVKKSDLTGAIGSVKAENIQAKGTTSVMQSLQGQIPGVNISQSSSRAGDGMSIQIRGKSTLGDASTPLYVIDGIVCDNMDFLNPADIEKVDILKDASSTAIYGSRATNGVVMITTKKGAVAGSKATISYDGYYGWKTVANMPDFMNGEEFMRYRLSRYLSAKQAADGTQTWDMSLGNYKNVWGAGSEVIQRMYKNNDYTDWANDEATRDGQQQNHFISITGNAKDISYRIGLGYQTEEGVLYDSYERWNLKGSVDHKVNDNWSAGISFNLATSLKASGSKNAVNNAFLMAPIMMARYKEDAADGSYKAGDPIYQPGKDAVMYPDGGGPTSTINPITDRENSTDNTRSYNALGNIYLQYSPIKEVILKTTFSPSYQKTDNGIFYGAKTQVRGGNGNQSEQTNRENFSYTWDTQANFVKSFGRDEEHSINVLGLFSVYDDRVNSNYDKTTNMPFDVYWYNWGSGTVENVWSDYTRIQMLSWVARINYNYRNRYLLTVSSRWDGSSKFAKDKRWGMFPSAALAWRINDEAFMEGTQDWLSNLKFRVSYGVTGNNAGVGAYQTLSMADTKYYYNFGGAVANGYGYALSNGDLTWEKTKEFNIGLDFGFINNRINGSIDFYNRNSEDLLMDLKTPLEMGSSTGAIVSNVGKVRNRGVEITLNTLNVQTRDWRWETTFTYGRNVNSIVELNGGKEDLVGNKWFIGHDIDVVYGYKILGIADLEYAKKACTDSSIPSVHEGEVIYEDMNKDGVINASDRQILGHASPTWTGSFNTSVSYKNWDFSMSVYASMGGTVYSPFMREFCRYGSRGTQHLKIDYYIPEGAPVIKDPSAFEIISGLNKITDASVTSAGVTYASETHHGYWPFPTSTNGNGGGTAFNTDNDANSYYFVDNSFVRIKNITLGYTFPSTWMQKLRIQSLRVYCNIINPFTWVKDYEGFDPEWANASVTNGKGGVSSRTYQVGINLKF